MTLNLVDVAVLLVVLGGLVRGALAGAALQALTLGGLAAGLIVGAGLAPRAAGLASDPTMKAIVAVLVLFLAVSVTYGLSRGIGVRVWGRLRRRGRALVDGTLGALLGATLALLGAWLAGAVVGGTPGSLGLEIHTSRILQALDRTLPPAPPLISRLQRLLEARGLPQVFAGLEPAPAPPLPQPSDPEVRQALSRAAPSTVKIEGRGCGGILDGSGFVVAADLVVTNAHVVAGIDRPVVVEGSRRQTAVPVLFDPELDVAVLRVARTEGPPLALLESLVERGTRGAVLGYPEGGPFDAQPAVVANRYTAVGRDIYSRGLASREVYELRARVRPGNSGGPLVRPDGAVIGVVFSRSVAQDDVGYALTSVEVAKRVDSARRSTSADTGSCTA